jgi:hypothetical protein
LRARRSCEHAPKAGAVGRRRTAILIDGVLADNGMIGLGKVMTPA